MSTRTTSTQRSNGKLNVEPRGLQGTLGLAVAMGIGRFFYTPVLPLMIAALHWTSSDSAWTATANYVGYLLGSAVMARGWLRPHPVTYRISLVASTALLAAVVVSPAVPWQMLVRTAAGFASALIFVCITQVLGGVLKRPASAGLVYGGVGTGITVSGLAVWLLGNAVGWQGLWLVAAAISAVFSIAAWSWPARAEGPERAAEKASTSNADASTDNDADKSADGAPTPPPANRSRLLSTGYFFEGFGYIIIGTYLVVLAGPVFGPTAAALTWIIAGVAAIPSPVLWSRIADRFGRRHALLACYLLQFIGAVAAVFGHSIPGLVIAAFLFGGTFMGVTMLSIATGANSGMPGAAARLTTWYSLGQVAGPALVAVVIGQSVGTAFTLAAVAVGLGAGLTAASRL
ncbi:YbfB/YjiJ family MFS transporter [Corynebacterium heidelbergense]|nr:YbfB/YjiJ family MFS transporter [Corynebacterium heidelbergense]WCZ35604.1 Major Facilitator Superfamily protein [Corynebacterium heidelbergense]